VLWYRSGNIIFQFFRYQKMCKSNYIFLSVWNIIFIVFYWQMRGKRFLSWQMVSFSSHDFLFGIHEWISTDSYLLKKILWKYWLYKGSVHVRCRYVLWDLVFCDYFIEYFGAVMIVIVWLLDLKLHNQFEPRSGEMYSIQHYVIKFVRWLSSGTPVSPLIKLIATI
jgi:hypothetical protein